MALGTTSIDGLISGLDTTSMITALANAKRTPITLLEKRASAQTTVLSAYTTLTGQLATLRNSAATLAQGTALQARSVTVSDSAALLASSSSGAAMGTYDITIDQLAQAHKVSSGTVADSNADLGFAGDLVINGKTVTLKASDDLVALKNAINSAQAGVSASITTVSSTDHRLVLRSLTTGVENSIEIAEAGDTGLLQSLGIQNGTSTTKSAITNGEQSDGFSSASTAVGDLLGLTAAQSGTIKVNDTDVAINLASDSLQDLADRISATVTGVTAEVTSALENGKTTYRLQLTGASAPTLTDDQGILGTLGLTKQGYANELQIPKDAIIEVDGSTITRSSNAIDDAVEGLSLDLLAADPETTLTVSVAANTSQAVTALQQVVNNYNSVIGSINAGQAWNADTSTGGSFFGESTILTLQDGLLNLATASVSTLGGDLTSLSAIGLSTDRYGQLSLDSTKLQEALEENPEGVMRLLTTQGDTTSSDVEFVSAGTNAADSGAGGYAVNITKNASRATATGDQLLTGIAHNETLTIGGKYNVLLTEGMSLDQACTKLNTVLQGNGTGMTASVVDNRLQIQSNFYGSNYAVNISSSLDDGAGGTGLGGATAGTTAVVYGENVEGTIGGKKAEGWGQWLTGSEGSVKDLKLKVTGSTIGDKGVVKVSQGLASRLSNYTTQVTDSSSGLVTRATDSITETITQISEDVDKMEESVQTYIEQLQLKFATLEALIAKNKITLQQITGQYTSSSDSSSS